MLILFLALAEEPDELAVKYAPMARLLKDSDAAYVNAHPHGSRDIAARVRREHRAIFVEYFRHLRTDVRKVRKARLNAIARGRWEDLDQLKLAAEFEFQILRLHLAVLLDRMHARAARALAAAALRELDRLVAPRELGFSQLLQDLDPARGLEQRLFAGG